MLHYRLEPRKECVRVGRRQNANRPGGGGVWRPGGPAGPRACQTKGWSRRPQAACSSLFGRFAPCRRPPRAVGGSTNAKRQRKARPRALRGLAGETMAGRAAAPAPPLRAKPLPCGQRRHTPAQVKRGSQKPPPVGGGFCEPQGGLRPPGDSFPGCACPLAPRRRWRCGRGAP